MKTVRHYGRFENGKLRANTFTAALRALSEKGVPVVLTVAEDKPKRSNPQNRYYRGVVCELIGDALKETGWDPAECTNDAVHAMLKMRFLKEDRPLGKDGEFITVVKSTTELDREEFGAYIEHCICFAAEYLNVVIPEPGQQMELSA